MATVVSGSTKLMAVIGDPVTQVKTPQAINPAFAARGLDIVSVPLHVPIGQLDACWQAFRAIPNLLCIGVTLPHKQEATRLCDTLDPLARSVGAVNIVRREPNGSLHGSQFDGKAFLWGLTDAGIAVKGRDILMLGAGGAALGVTYALAEAGANRIIVANRTKEKAALLSTTVNNALGKLIVQPGKPVTLPGQLVVNATSLGMTPHDDMPIAPESLANDVVVAELIAEPEYTPLLTAAKARGLKVHSGMQMIRGQVECIVAHLATALH